MLLAVGDRGVHSARASRAELVEWLEVLSERLHYYYLEARVRAGAKPHHGKVLYRLQTARAFERSPKADPSTGQYFVTPRKTILGTHAYKAPTLNRKLNPTR